MAFLESLLSGVISGVVASGLFYWYMTKMRPSIFICDNIVKSSDTTGLFYAFKIYNNSRFFDVLDLKIEVYVKTPFNAHGGQNYNLEKIELKKDHVMLLPRCSKANEPDASYALIVTTRVDVEKLWLSDSQHVEIHIHGRHSFSGASKSYSKKFYTKRNSIKEGMFNFGKTNSVS